MQKLKFISKEQLLELMENKEDFVLVDALSEEDYKEGHIIGAVNIPVDKAEQLIPRMLPDKNKFVITYCSDFLCMASTHVARLLQDMGYANVADYKGGKKDWTNASLPLMKE